MIPPPSEGNVYDMVPPGTGNPEAWGVKLAWDAWQVLAGQALDQALTEIQLMQGVAM